MSHKHIIGVDHKEDPLSIDELALYHQQLVELVHRGKLECAVVKLALKMKEMGIESGQEIVHFPVPFNSSKEIGAKIVSIHIPPLPFPRVDTSSYYKSAYCTWRVYICIPTLPPISEAAAAFLQVMGEAGSSYQTLEQTIPLISLPLTTIEQLTLSLKQLEKENN